MKHVYALIVCAFLVGCGKSDQSLWLVYEGNDPNAHAAQGRPVVSGNSVTFSKWPSGDPVTLSGKFKVEKAETTTCPFCKKTIFAGAFECRLCNKKLVDFMTGDKFAP